MLYEEPGDRNGKMSLRFFRDIIQQPVFKPWLADARLNKTPFTLTKDGDSGYGGGRSNIVCTRKRKPSWTAV